MSQLTTKRFPSLTERLRTASAQSDPLRGGRHGGPRRRDSFRLQQPCERSPRTGTETSCSIVPVYSASLAVPGAREARTAAAVASFTASHAPPPRVNPDTQRSRVDHAQCSTVFSSPRWTGVQFGYDMTVGVFGPGYVGTVTAASLAENGHEVWHRRGSQQDRPPLAGGISPAVEPGLDELISKPQGSVDLSSVGW